MTMVTEPLITKTKPEQQFLMFSSKIKWEWTMERITTVFISTLNEDINSPTKFQKDPFFSQRISTPSGCFHTANYNTGKVYELSLPG